MDRANGVRSVVDLEVRPVVAVGQDVAPIVGVAPDPSVKRLFERGMIDPRAVVPEFPVCIEANGAFARRAGRRGEAVEVGMVAGLYARES